MPTLLFASALDPAAEWASALRARMPDLAVRIWPEVGDRTQIDYVLCWLPEPTVFDGLSKLSVVFSLGAGVDSMLRHPGLPETVPLVRMMDPALTEGMREFVLYNVLRIHRHGARYEAQRARRSWRKLAQVRPGARRVGVMGMGALGADVAERLAGLGFDVAGWSLRAKRIPGVVSHAGEGALAAFAARSEILICLLPLTEGTAGILSRSLFERLPRGAWLINVARGEHLIEADLLAALDGGGLAGAVLDVHRSEPLASDHPFWSDARIELTPHIASLANPESGSAAVVEGVRCQRAGEPLRYVVDRARGY